MLLHSDQLNGEFLNNLCCAILRKIIHHDHVIVVLIQSQDRFKASRNSILLVAGNYYNGNFWFFALYNRQRASLKRDHTSLVTLNIAFGLNAKRQLISTFAAHQQESQDTKGRLKKASLKPFSIQLSDLTFSFILGQI